VPPHTTVYDSIALMSEKSVGALLVLDGRRLAGIVSERDYMRKIILQGRASKDTPVEEIMTREVITAPPNLSIEEAMRLMTENRIRHLPVVSEDEVVGVVSIGDLVKAVISAHEETIAHLHHFIGGGYMA
jgi:CBS domain-containing protein